VFEEPTSSGFYSLEKRLSLRKIGLSKFMSFDIRQQNLVKAVGLKLLVPSK
jgi:hypothetical protein